MLAIDKEGGAGGGGGIHCRQGRPLPFRQMLRNRQRWRAGGRRARPRKWQRAAARLAASGQREGVALRHGEVCRSRLALRPRPVAPQPKLLAQEL